MKLKRYDIETCDEYSNCHPVVESLGGDLCYVGDIIKEIKARIQVTNTLPQQQLALQQLLEWMMGCEKLRFDDMDKDPYAGIKGLSPEDREEILDFAKQRSEEILSDKSGQDGP